MGPHPTRRGLLRTGGALASASLAGCSSLLGADDPVPDSYGVALENELEETYAVSISGDRTLEGESVFEETVEIDPGERREWESVFEDDGTYRLSAFVDDSAFGPRVRSDGLDFHVGGDRGLEVENILVLLEYVEARGPATESGPQVLVSGWGHPDDYRDEN